MKYLFFVLALIPFFRPGILNAQNINGILDYELIQDADGDGFADPGDIVRYDAVVVNTEASPVDVATITFTLSDAVSVIPNSLSSSVGTIAAIKPDGLNLVVITLGSLPPNSSNHAIFDVSLNAPLGFEPGDRACTTAHLKYPNGSGFEFGYAKDEIPGFGTCVKQDFDSDNIDDTIDICVNLPQSTAKLDLPLPTSNSGSTEPLITKSTLNVTRVGNIEDIVPKLLLNHSWVGDLKISLTHVATGKTVVLLDRPGVPVIPGSSFGCGADNIRAEFEDGAGPTAEDFCDGGPFAISGIFSPVTPLSVFNGESMSGDWILTIEDYYRPDDGGSLTQWCMRFTASTNITANITAPEKSIAGNKFLQKLTLTNTGPSDMIDLAASHVPSFGLTLTKGNRFSFLQIPAGESKTIEYEVTSTSAFPYKEILVNSPSAVAGVYEALDTEYSAPITSISGVSGELINPEFKTFSCDLANPGALSGKIAIFGQVPCNEDTLVSAVSAAGATGVILTTHDLGVSHEILLPVVPFGDAASLNIKIPVLSASASTSEKLIAAEGTKGVTLRANPLRNSWNVTSAIKVSSDEIYILNGDDLGKQLDTKTEIQIDTDGDGVSDISDQCKGDGTKSAPGVCGCGVADTDSDGDGKADCVDLCQKDPAKESPGVCGCGTADSDGNKNGIIDCLTGGEILVRYNTINSSFKMIKPVKSSGNKKKDKAKKAALKSKTDEIKKLLAEIDLLVKSPVTPVSLTDKSLSLTAETSNVNKALQAGLKTNSKKFGKNKKAAQAALAKILGLIKV
jgi:subtilisin-like proprotein convertase family protein